MSAPLWNDLYNADELAELLEKHAETMALRYGKYDMCAELRHGAQCIRDLADRCEFAAQKAEAMAASILEAQVIARASLESLSKLGPGSGPQP